MSSSLSLKVLLFAAGVGTVTTVVQSAVPLLLDFSVYDLPEICSVLRSSLKPPFLYLLINVIILTVAATSRFHRHISLENQSQSLICSMTANLLDVPAVVYDVLPRVFEEPQQQITSSPPLPEIISPVKDKPLATFRFAQQKPMKTSPEGVSKSLRVVKPKKHETLESTWKTITDGRPMPLKRHLRKSETFDNHRHSDVYRSGEENKMAAGNTKKVVRKSATLKDRTNYDNQNHRPPPPPSNSLSPASGGKVRKEGLLSHDELNRRVEAFIKKFNDEMRLQRQESTRHKVCT